MYIYIYMHIYIYIYIYIIYVKRYAFCHLEEIFVDSKSHSS